jgi:hypothetical protein
LIVREKYWAKVRSIDGSNYSPSSGKSIETVKKLSSRKTIGEESASVYARVQAKQAKS